MVDGDEYDPTLEAAFAQEDVPEAKPEVESEEEPTEN
jgi:hypothetical protein